MNRTMWTAVFASIGVVGMISAAMATPIFVPEPQSMSLFGVGIGAVVACRYLLRRNR